MERKDFLRKNGEFTVNIALISNSEPVLGVIYIPVKQVLYYAPTVFAITKELVNHKIPISSEISTLRATEDTGQVQGAKTGHHLNNLLLKEIFSSPDNYAIC